MATDAGKGKAMARRDGDLWIVTDSITGKTYAAETVWTISRGRDTYGYNICTLFVDGNKAAKCSGGGYDMTGTCIGDWLQNTFQDRLRGLTPHYTWCKEPYRPMTQNETTRENYGLTFQVDGNGKTLQAELDGGCGKESMIRIAEQIGLKFEYKR